MNNTTANEVVNNDFNNFNETINKKDPIIAITKFTLNPKIVSGKDVSPIIADKEFMDSYIAGICATLVEENILIHNEYNIAFGFFNYGYAYILLKNSSKKNNVIDTSILIEEVNNTYRGRIAKFLNQFKSHKEHYEYAMSTIVESNCFNINKDEIPTFFITRQDIDSDCVEDKGKLFFHNSRGYQEKIYSFKYDGEAQNLLARLYRNA